MMAAAQSINEVDKIWEKQKTKELNLNKKHW